MLGTGRIQNPYWTSIYNIKAWIISRQASLQICGMNIFDVRLALSTVSNCSFQRISKILRVLP